MKYLES